MTAANVRSLQVPNGAALAGSGYGVDSAPARSLGVADSARVAGGGEFRAPMFLDPKHCQYISVSDAGDDYQCRSWPVTKDGVDNPNRLCAGHLRKQLAYGSNAGTDEDVRTNEP